MLKKILVNIIVIILSISISICIYATETSPEEGSESSLPAQTEPVDPPVESTPPETPSTNEGEDNSSSANTEPEPNTNTDTNAEQNNNNDNNNSDNNNNSNQEQPKEQPTSETPQTTTTTKKSTSTNTTKNNNTTNNTSTKSDDATLNELTVDVEGLNPAFDKDTTKYYLSVNLDVEQVTVTATPSDSNAKVTVSGNKKLKEGENTITINVKAEDGTTKKYYIYVTKSNIEEMENANLKLLQIKDYNLSPEFKPSVYIYNIEIGEDTSELEITAEPAVDDAKIEIEGNSNLGDGKKLIKINVTAKDGSTVKTYKINTYAPSEEVEVKEESKTPAIILLAILGVCIIGLGTFMIIKNKKEGI